MRALRAIAILATIGFLSGCGMGEAEKPPYQGIKLGSPYQINGTWYKPHYESDYDETGMASWYGPGFHGGHTANGEKYDQEALTGAHRTLPMPSLVRVTNLDNGKSAIVRINDRGPFARSRIIDVSRAAAVKLGMIRTGTAKVRVQFLANATHEYVQRLRNGTAYSMEHYNSPAFTADEERGVAPHETMAAVPGGGAPAEAPVMVSNTPPVETPPAPPQEAVPPSDIFSVVDNAQGAEPAPQAAIPASYKPTGYFIQAGTFVVAQNAERLQNTLRTETDAQVMEVMVHNRKSYRVMLGPYEDPQNAKNMLSKLALMGIPDAKIIHN